MNSVRQWIVRRIGIIAQLLEDVTGKHHYVDSTKHNEQFVGRVDMCAAELERELEAMGFEQNPLSSWKNLKSLRKIDLETHPGQQLHVVLYDADPINNPKTDAAYVYAHLEDRWDKRPIDYARRERMSGPNGVKKLKKLFDENGIRYEPIRP